MAENLLRVKILADTRGLQNSLKSASARLKTFGSNMTALGSQLQTRLALPLIAVGGSAIKMAADFDKSMTQIKTLVGVATDEVDRMGVAATRMAQATGKSASEAAEALFFITSAGLRGESAMAVLEQSLKASAIGLGETKVVADLATSALNAYGIENLSASEATDILTGAVREGKLSADSLAQSMGTVLPIASQLGVRFSEVGATFAAMSRTGTDASMAATQIRGILFSLLKPSKQANDTLQEFGLSAKGLREQIREEGLLETLKTLTVAFGDNEEAQGKVFGNVRALSGVLDLLGNNLSTTEKIFDSMNNTVGITSEAFDTLQESSAFKMQKAFNDIKISLTELGSVLLTAVVPLIQKFSSFVLKLYNSFQRLSPEMKNFSVSLGLILTALPTIIMALGGLVSAIGVIISPIGLVVAGIIGLVLAANDLQNILNDLEITIKTALINSLSWATEKFQLFINTMNRYGAVIKKFFEEGFDADFTDINKEFDEIADKIKKVGQEERKTNKETAQLLKNYNDLPSTFSQVKKFFTFVETGAKNTATETKKLNQDLSNTFKVLNPFTVVAQKLDGGIGLDPEKIKTTNEKVKEIGNTIKNAQESTEYWAGTLGGILMDSFISLGEGGSFLKPLIDGLKQLIIKLAAAAAVAAILFALTGGMSAGGSSLGSFSKIFSMMAGMPQGAVPFANGGIVSGPTLGLMGEYAGARSNPEVIAPLDKLKGMIGQTGGQNVNVSGEFRVQGQDLVVALQRAEKNRSRLL
jgi:TP901 family phage tail tape measure protein